MNQIITLTKRVRDFLISNEKKTLINFLRIFIAVGLLIYIVSKVEPKNIYNTLITADYIVIAFVVSLMFLNIFLQFIKWNLISSTLLNVSDKKKNFYSLMYGISAAAFTPMRLGEYIGRSIALKNISFMEIVVATAIDKFMNLYILTIAGSISIVLFLHFYLNISFFITITLFVLIFSGLYLFTFLFFKRDFWSDFIFKQLSKFKSLYSYVERISVLKTFNKKELNKILIFTFLHFFCYVTQFGLLIYAFENSGNILIYIWGGILMMFSKTFIPALTIAEIGIREGASIFFLTILGATAASAFNASFLLFVINILIPAVIGMILLSKRIND